MPKDLVTYLTQRNDASTFLLPADLGRTLEDLFPRPESLLPQPFKIFPADETLQPVLGFPVAESAILKELDSKLDKWLADPEAVAPENDMGFRVNDAAERSAIIKYLKQLANKQGKQ